MQIKSLRISDRKRLTGARFAVSFLLPNLPNVLNCVAGNEDQSFGKTSLAISRNPSNAGSRSQASDSKPPGLFEAVMRKTFLRML